MFSSGTCYQTSGGWDDGLTPSLPMCSCQAKLREYGPQGGAAAAAATASEAPVFGGVAGGGGAHRRLAHHYLALASSGLDQQVRGGDCE